MPDNYNYLTVKSVANMLNISAATVRRLIDHGYLSGAKKSPASNSPYMVSRASVTAYLKAYRDTNTNDNEATGATD